MVEAGGRLLPIEVKAPAVRAWPTPRTCAPSAPSTAKAPAPACSFTPAALEWLAPDVLAAPWWKVL